MYLNWKYLWLKELFFVKIFGCIFKLLLNKYMLENLFYVIYGYLCRCSLELFLFEVNILF